MALWCEVHSLFEDAFRHGNNDLVGRVFQYAAWCIDTAKPQPTDASTAAVCAFYEHLPLIAGLPEQLHRFLPRQRFLHIQHAFRYHLTEPEFVHFRDAYLARASS